MELAVKIIIGMSAISHLYFLILEMFLWTKPLGLKIFGQTEEKAKITEVLASNQGLYNGFLAAGLIWGIICPFPLMCYQLRVFFLSCVVTAGVYGGITVNKKIFFVQALPALVALILINL